RRSTYQYRDRTVTGRGRPGHKKVTDPCRTDTYRKSILCHLFAFNQAIRPVAYPYQRLGSNQGGQGVFESLANTLDIPVAAVYGLAFLIVVQLILPIYCLVGLARRKHVTCGRKWLCALILLAISNGVGSILYLADG